MLASRRLGLQPELRRAVLDGRHSVVKGSGGEHVAVLQDLLMDLGGVFTLSLKDGRFDGIFGKETENSVKAFQAGNRLKVDGIVGPKTLAALDHQILIKPQLEIPNLQDVTEERLYDAWGPQGQRTWHW